MRRSAYRVSDSVSRWQEAVLRLDGYRIREVCCSVGRKLVGTVKATGRTWEAAVPRSKGSPQRRTARFFKRAVAERWRADAVAALEAGQRLPDPADYRSTSQRSRAGASVTGGRAEGPRSFEGVAWMWHAERYEHFRHAAPGRAAEVAATLRRRLLPFFAGYRVDEIERSCPGCANDYRTACPRRGRHREVKALVLALAGRGETTVRRTVEAAQAHADGEVSLDQAAELCRVHRATIKRWLRAGKLPGSRIHPETGRRTIAVGALVQAGKLGDAAPAHGLSRRYASDIVWMLRSILEFARTHGWIIHNPADGMLALDPDPAAARTSPPRERPRPLTLAECHAAAAHLHLPHQAALWLQRLLGLRVAEAFGPRVGDLLDDGGHGLLVVRRQGGRPFLTRNEEGQIVTVDEIDQTKNSHSYRVLAVPATLMRLLRVLIVAYHTDPASGRVDLDSRLIPGLREPNRGGITAYTTALGKALRAVGLSAEDLGFRIGSHHLRKSLATDLAFTDVDDLVQRRVLGHVAGHDVHARHYLLDVPASQAHLEVARGLDASVEGSVGSLLVPTAKRPSFGPQHPGRDRHDYVETILTEAWGQARDDHKEPLLGTSEVADLLGEPVTTVRRWMRQGKIPVVIAADRFGAERRMVRQRDAQVFLAEQRARWSFADAADELGVSYQEARKTFHRLGLEAARSPSGEHHFDETAIAALRTEFDRIARLHERSIRVSDTARKLRVVPDTVYKAIRRGELKRDAETDGTGARYVTRSSLDAYRERVPRGGHSSASDRGGMVTDRIPHRGDGADPALIPLSYIKELTGLTSVQLKALADARHLQFATRGRRTYLTRESVERWASGYRPDLLSTLQNQR